ncbi:ATP-binding protein [Parapedobacter sp. GCM10030251]|uniref:PAS domain-containing sensor histidine kinase n=1 Tax=Parapedobacter sp. GCM10030251 TaxID=3273419 RepID=UPI003605B18F
MGSNERNHLADDFDDFFDTSLYGMVIADGEGRIDRINRRAAEWLNSSPQEFQGKRFADLLAVGGKIYFETHLWPLLRMQGYFDEVSVELADTGKGKMPVYLNGYERRDENNHPLFMRFTLFRASDRRLYEQNLQLAKQLAETALAVEQQHAVIREQFIAVLGHDLRNPLTGIVSATQMLARTESGRTEERFIRILQNSSKRMQEMINNIMDLARGRLGGGISISPTTFSLDELLYEVSEELKVAWPDRTVETYFDVKQKITGDPSRIAQLASNLLANAITHGAADTPVVLKAITDEKFWEISITNQGKPIPEEALPHLFHPFQRQDAHASQNGLGLGLYIASEIAKAHNGELKVSSNEQETCFSFRGSFGLLTNS